MSLFLHISKCSVTRRYVCVEVHNKIDFITEEAVGLQCLFLTCRCRCGVDSPSAEQKTHTHTHLTQNTDVNYQDFYF